MRTPLQPPFAVAVLLLGVCLLLPAAALIAECAGERCPDAAPTVEPPMERCHRGASTRASGTVDEATPAPSPAAMACCEEPSGSPAAEVGSGSLSGPGAVRSRAAAAVVATSAPTGLARPGAGPPGPPVELHTLHRALLI